MPTRPIVSMRALGTGLARVFGCRAGIMALAIVPALVIAALMSAPGPATVQGQDKSQDKSKGVGGPPPMQVGVDVVRSEPLKQTVPVIGRLVARQTGVVAARINGPVGAFRADVGDRVKAGDVLATLVPDSLRWDVELRKAEEKQYAAAVATAKARIQFRRQELARLEGLRQSAAFSQARLDDKRQEVVVAESELAEAEGRLASARANRKLAEINLHNATIRAPYSGVVTQRHTEVGAYVSTGQPLVSLVGDADMEIEADVPNNRVPGLEPGTAVTARINGGPTVTARVRAVVPSENPQTRTRTVRFVPELPNDARGLAANQSVTLQVPASEEGTVVTVHKDAVLARNGSRVVYRVKNDEAHARNVILGDAVGNRFIVKTGLRPGDLVVVRGNERLRPGQKLKYDPSAKDAGGAEKPAAAGSQG